MAHPIPKKKRILNYARWQICEEVLSQGEKNVLRMLEETNMTQKELAAFLGVSQPYVSHTYNKALDKINPLMNILSETVDKILGIYI